MKEKIFADLVRERFNGLILDWRERIAEWRIQLHRAAPPRSLDRVRDRLAQISQQRKRWFRHREFVEPSHIAAEKFQLIDRLSRRAGRRGLIAAKGRPG